VQLLAYADRVGGSLQGLKAVLQGSFSRFSGVHILPFFLPFDGVDAGFDPVNHSLVDPRLGTWDDVREIAGERIVTADLIVNHVSSTSDEFVDWLAKGELSEHDGMFLTFDTVFPGGASEAEITAFYRPRPGLPFVPYEGGDGRRMLVWATFGSSQIDLDVASPKALRYLDHILATMANNGVSTVRLDAVGYAVKTAGTDSFMTDETLKFVTTITAMAHARGLRVLVEVHAHFTQQLAVAPLVDLVYDFALAPLVLHAFGTGLLERLEKWLNIRPRNCVTVLDTHDGIGIIDAGPSGEKNGLLDFDEMADIFHRAEIATGGLSAEASVVPAWATLPHQINATFFSAMGGDATRYIMARAIQLWLPGEPQIYYVGALAGLDDEQLFRQTLNGRDVNRHSYTEEEIDEALSGEVTRALLALVELRNTHRAFRGSFTHTLPSDSRMELSWRNAADSATLTVDVDPTTLGFEIAITDSDWTRRFAGIPGLLGAAAEENAPHSR
jgi:sucrose phosphorylase